MLDPCHSAGFEGNVRPIRSNETWNINIKLYRKIPKSNLYLLEDFILKTVQIQNVRTLIA